MIHFAQVSERQAFLKTVQMLLEPSSALFLKLLRMRLCLTRHTINRERLLCKGRDEIVLLSPHRHAGFRAGRKPVSSKVHNAVPSRLVST